MAAILSGVMPTLAGLPMFNQTGSTLVMSNANVRIEYKLGSGAADFFWQNSKKISAFYSGVTLSTGYIKGTNYTSWTWAMVTSNQVAITATGNGHPTMKQYFTLDQDNSFLARVEMRGTNLSANWMGPVVVDTTGGVDLGSYNDNRALFVPFDNDHFVRYNAETINGSDTGHEAGAFYDNITRNGLVVGSVTHDMWKTGVYWAGSNNRLDKLNVFGGVTSHWTWDVMPHGSVTGSTISSPTVFVGFGNDWRTMLEALADENTLYAPKLPWTNGVPFGWNSWGVTNYQDHISYSAAIAVSDSIRTNLQTYGFGNNGTVYVNLDSFWDNLSDSQLQSFSSHCHANGQKAGVYWGPFVWWGSAANAGSSRVEGSSYLYSDVLLHDGSGNYETNDGALAMDPTHPGTQMRIAYYVNRFTNDGFDYIKLDFLSHGSLEGIHFDPAVTTGIQAYNQGMQYLFNQLNGRMFISESIAPIFPYRYGHSRRIACDAQQSKIGDTEYTMNSVAYGWWVDRLYSFNDPDIIVFGNGPDANENQSRLISGAVTGIFLDGDILTNSTSIATAQNRLTNVAINAVARAGRSFRTIEGNTGSSATDLFVQQTGPDWYVAAFNYSSTSTNKTVDLNRAGIPSGTWLATNLWDGTASVVSNSLGVSLNAKQTKLYKLVLAVKPRPAIISIRSSGTSWVLSGTNVVSGETYLLLASANLALPMAQWSPVATNTFSGGSFSMTNAPSSNASQRFYAIRVM